MMDNKEQRIFFNSKTLLLPRCSSLSSIVSKERRNIGIRDFHLLHFGMSGCCCCGEGDGVRGGGGVG